MNDEIKEILIKILEGQDRLQTRIDGIKLKIENIEKITNGIIEV